jgi:hypothetical protein
MKNCLDWLEVTANRYEPYLTDKTIGLVCWADGLQAMQGINAMDVIAKSLRAWHSHSVFLLSEPHYLTLTMQRDFTALCS